jgi:DNA-nicking Smr family endonuclease
MSRRRPLSDEERTLWKTYARSIKPLRGGTKIVEPDIEEAKAPAKILAKPHAASRSAAPRETPSPKLPPLAPLDRRMKQRVARGRDPIEARLDLHGMTQMQAHAELLRFLRRAQADGARTVLVVTGKGFRAHSRGGKHDADREPGVLRRQVPMWLALPEFRLLVVGFDDAHAGHGGQGALYVRLRRAR